MPPQRLPKLERLLLDTDVNAYVERYLTAVGFDVLFAARVDVDVRDDTAILKWARRHRRILVCHDKHRDGQTRVKLFLEVYENGGRVIRIGGTPDQPPITSVGKILVRRADWSAFFKENNDGMVLVHGTGTKPMPRSYLHRQVQGAFFDATDNLRKRKKAHRPYRPRKTPASPEQAALNMR